MARRPDGNNRLDDAARAGWLYYVAGRTQDEIAAAMGISRQSAQRLVSLAMAERLIKVRLDHPIAACLELGLRLKEKFDLRQVDIVPSDPGLVIDDGRHCRGGGGRDRALAEIGRSDHPGDRHGANAEGGDRPASGDGMSAAPHRLFDRQYRPGWVGGLLQRHLLDGGCGQGAAFSDAACRFWSRRRKSGRCCTTRRWSNRPCSLVPKPMSPLSASVNSVRRHRFARTAFLAADEMARLMDEGAAGRDLRLDV